MKKKNQKKKFFPDENIIFTLPKASTILDDEDFETKQERKRQKDDEIQQEIDLKRHNPNKAGLFEGSFSSKGGSV